jgi:dephospho-CoA kinase
MLKIGITGGIGTGKTTVCKIFETFSIPVFHADEESKKILMEDPGVHDKLKKIFGDEIFTNSIPDRKKIADIVFNDKEKLEQLNSILHPATIRKSEEWFSELNDVPYAIKEAALIFEIGAEKFLDKVIVVSAPEALSIERIMKRDHATEKEVRSRIKNQMEQKLKEDKADFIIVNDDSQPLIPQVMNIHEQLQFLAKVPES